MKLKTSQSLAVLALALSGGAFAQTAAPAAAPAAAPEPEYTIAYNLGAVTEYRYLGISQSSRKPALQGGVDYTNKNGVYLGTWLSTISWIKNASSPTVAKGPVEWDLYGGYKGDIAKDFSYDVGGLYYFYPTNTNTKNGGVNANTFEVYGALTYNIVTAKYSRSTTNLFGTPNSSGSGYLDLSANFDLGSGWSIVPHYGHQSIKNGTPSSYSDYSFTVAKDFDGLVVSAALIGTNKGGQFIEAASGKDLFKSSLVLGIKKNF